MAPVAIGAMVVGAMAAAYAAYRSTQAQRASATYNSKVQEQNAKLAELQAKDTEARGRLEEDAYRKRLGQAQGSQLAALAGTGVDLGAGGSALDLRRDLATAGNLDALSIRMNTQREAYAQRLQGTGASAEAALARNQAAYANPYIAGGTSLAASGGSFAGMWYMNRDPGTPPPTTPRYGSTGTNRGPGGMRYGGT
jgi:hypothetical protein